MLSRSLALALVVVAASPVLAEEPPPPAAPPAAPVAVPSADDVKKVTNYYLKGHDQGPILLDLLLCTKVEKNAEKKNECVAELPPSIKKGEPITAFIKLMVPQGPKYEDVKLKFLLDGEVRSTSDYTVEQSWSGYSVYKTVTGSKGGTWEVQVLWGANLLASKKIKVE